jgi:hypothetical protein
MAEVEAIRGRQARDNTAGYKDSGSRGAAEETCTRQRAGNKDTGSRRRQAHDISRQYSRLYRWPPEGGKLTTIQQAIKIAEVEGPRRGGGPGQY